MREIKDKDGTWQVRDGVKYLVQPSAEFETRRAANNIKSAQQEAEREVVAGVREKYYNKLYKSQTLTMSKPRWYDENKAEMSFDDMIESVKSNKQAASREVLEGR